MLAMKRFQLPRASHASACFWATWVLLSISSGIYSGLKETMPPDVWFLGSVALVSALYVIILEDDRAGDMRRVYDLGWFACAWALLGPYYLWRTRGKSGLWLIAAFIMVEVLASYCGLMIGRALLR